MSLILVGIFFFIPTLLIDKPFGEFAQVFFIAWFFTLLTVAIGALLANALTLGTKRMVIRPTSLPWVLIVVSILFTRLIMKALMMIRNTFAGIHPGAEAYESFADGLNPLIAFSPYHQGGALLSSSLGGPASPDLAIFLVPVILLALGIWASRKVYPDIYVKE